MNSLKHVFLSASDIGYSLEIGKECGEGNGSALPEVLLISYETGHRLSSCKCFTESLWSPQQLSVQVGLQGAGFGARRICHWIFCPPTHWRVHC